MCLENYTYHGERDDNFAKNRVPDAMQPLGKKIEDLLPAFCPGAKPRRVLPPKRQNKFKSVFSGDMRVGENTGRLRVHPQGARVSRIIGNKIVGFCPRFPREAESVPAGCAGQPHYWEQNRQILSQKTERNVKKFYPLRPIHTG